MGRRAARVLENLSFFFLLVFFLSAASSIAYSEVAIVVAVLFWIVRGIVGRRRPSPAGPSLRLLHAGTIAWAVASILSVLFAEERGASWAKLVKLLPIGLLFYLPRALGTEARLRHAAGALLVGGAITSAYGIAYYLNDPSTRLGGFIGFYMTTAGVLLLTALAGAALLVTRGVGGNVRRIAWGSVPVVLVALVLTDTRGAWIGLFAGLLALGFLVARRLAAIPVVLLALLLLVPGKPRETALSAVDLRHPRNRERLFMWKAGLAIFRDHPWTGVGLSGMDRIYRRYQDPQSKERPPHLHSVPIQLLAGMGIAGFVAWVFLFGSMLAWMLRAREGGTRGPPIARALVLGGIVSWVAFAANGLVEWNLGDLEVITLFWAVMGLAAAAAGVANGEALRAGRAR